ncbi:hypothetical protein NRI_0372 [Neorickettsia risticii str. Illinois]|uniref:Uncharacterized protein n=1 Tax=Neorickettsia risticii (strain Illinois) TaxID=434131 RepID=C6V4P1_NEORI|nr:hypothetical protein NRI_0372 [Neorickettsia risticii str. Illinois]
MAFLLVNSRLSICESQETILNTMLCLLVILLTSAALEGYLKHTVRYELE